MVWADLAWTGWVPDPEPYLGLDAIVKVQIQEIQILRLTYRLKALGM